MFVRQWGLITHNFSTVSPWVAHFAGRIPSNSGSKRVLDYACGTGRHTVYLAELGYQVLAVDIHLPSLQTMNQCQPNAIELRCIDFEKEEFAFDPQLEKFSGLIVTNYLYRPHLGNMLELIDEGGVLIYETFAIGNEAFGKPSNPNFLLRENELLEVVLAKKSFHVNAFESGYVEDPKPAMIQRICAVRT
jgi:SAM-dependent methyltransferase